MLSYVEIEGMKQWTVQILQTVIGHSQLHLDSLVVHRKFIKENSIEKTEITKSKGPPGIEEADVKGPLEKEDVEIEQLYENLEVDKQGKSIEFNGDRKRD